MDVMQTMREVYQLIYQVRLVDEQASSRSLGVLAHFVIANQCRHTINFNSHFMSSSKRWIICFYFSLSNIYHSPHFYTKCTIRYHRNHISHALSTLQYFSNLSLSAGLSSHSFVYLLSSDLDAKTTRTEHSKHRSIGWLNTLHIKNTITNQIRS